MNFAKGYLTFTLAFITFLGGLAGWALGVIDQETATTMIWGSVALFGLRRALPK
jgi:hypothetical protein